MDILKFSVIGSVDDGKSTLIGRLLYDSKSIMIDQLKAVTESSKRRGEEGINLALLTDGLKAEREQGITIDVAYRYFSTDKRKFIIADCPGHIQYTRNMITGTSQVNLSILLVDARLGIQEQTKRHAFLASVMQVKHLVICVNKMDLVDYSEDVFNKIKAEFFEFTSKLPIADIHVIPVSALDGDNIVEKSNNMDWYKGSGLLYTLENVYPGGDQNFVDCRFPIQRVIRPQSDTFHDFRGFAGRVEGGTFRKGDKVTLLPSGLETKIKAIRTMDKDLEEAYHPMSILMQLEDEIDLSRGDMIVKKNNQPQISQNLDLIICWMSQTKLNLKRKYVVSHLTNHVRAMFTDIHYKMDINTLHRDEADQNIGINDIGRVKLKLSKPIFYDEFSKNKNTGGLIIIDEQTNETVALGLIRY